jgi:hypothetical protein
LIALAIHKFDFLPFYVGYGWKWMERPITDWSSDINIVAWQGEKTKENIADSINYKYLDLSLLNFVHAPNIDSGRSTFRCFKKKGPSSNPIFGQITKP